MNYTKLTLGELLSSEDETIKRNAISILKQLISKSKNVYNIVNNIIDKNISPQDIIDEYNRFKR